MKTSIPAPLLLLLVSIGTLLTFIGDQFKKVYNFFSAKAFSVTPIDGKDAAVITGASDGIGFEIAKCFARDGFNLVIIADKEKKLESAKNELSKLHDNIKIFTIVKDLSDNNAPQEIFDEVMRNTDIHVRFLVNNAGSALRGYFTKMSLEESLNMIDLNDKHVVAMTYLFGRQFEKELAQDPNVTFRIMNLSSIVSLLTTPYQAVYSATKSFIHAFTLAYGEEMVVWKGRFTATNLCPGFTSTKLVDNIGANESIAVRLFKVNDTPDNVAKIGYKGMMSGRRYIIPGYMNNLTHWFFSLLPIGWSLKFMKFLVADSTILKKPEKIAREGFTVERGNEISAQ